MHSIKPDHNSHANDDPDLLENVSRKLFFGMRQYYC